MVIVELRVGLVWQVVGTLLGGLFVTGIRALVGSKTDIWELSSLVNPPGCSARWLGDHFLPLRGGSGE